MNGKSGFYLAVFLAALICVTACKRGSNQDLSSLGPSSAATSTTLPFGSPQCPIGGVRIDTGIDANGNGVLDAAEVVRAVPVCYDPGATGISYGYNSLIKIESEPTGTLHCAAGGLKLLSGIDTNKSNALDSSEITYTEYVCNGPPGSGSVAGMTVAVSPPAVPTPKEKEKKKSAKPSPKKTKQAASDAPANKPGKAGAKAPVQPSEKEQNVVAAPKKENAKTKAARTAAPEPAGPQGWIAVKVASPQLAKVTYKIDGRYIIVRFANLSKTSSVRFKYTVKWKAGQNESWVDDSTLEGIGFRLKPLETLDREIPTRAQSVKDVVVELEISETAGTS